MAISPWSPPSSSTISTRLQRPSAATTYSTGGDSAIGGAGGGTIGGGSGTGSTGLPRTVGPTGPAVKATTTSPNAIGAVPNPNVTSAGIGGGVPIGAAAAAPPPVMSNFPQNGTQPMTGWLASIGLAPEDVMGMNQMPSRYLGRVLEGRGMDPTGGQFYQLEPLADNMMPLMELMYGGGRTIDQGGFDINNTGNFMGGMWSNLMTPGGRGFDVGELFGHLMNPGGEENILYNLLNAGAPEEQIESFRKYAMMIGQLGGSPMYQQALSNYLSKRGYDYLRAFEGGQEAPGTFGQFVGSPAMGGR
jgi:hypothetical protein